MCRAHDEAEAKQEMIRDIRHARNLEIHGWINEDRQRSAGGRHVLRRWLQSIKARSGWHSKKPCKLPELIVKYLCQVQRFIVGELVQLNPDGSIVTVLSPRDEYPVRTGMTLLPAAEPVPA
jgi:hypothetical protein